MHLILVAIDFEKISQDVYYKLVKEKSVLYEDAQDGYDYKKGRFSLRTLNLTGKEKELLSSSSVKELLNPITLNSKSIYMDYRL